MVFEIVGEILASARKGEARAGAWDPWVAHTGGAGEELVTHPCADGGRMNTDGFVLSQPMDLTGRDPACPDPSAFAIHFLVDFVCLLWVVYFFKFISLVFILFLLQPYLRIILWDTKPRPSLLYKISCMNSQKSVPALFLHPPEVIFKLWTPSPTDFNP